MQSSKAQLSQIAQKSKPEAAHASKSRAMDRKLEKGRRPESSWIVQSDGQPSTSQRSSQPASTADGQQHPRCNKCGRHH